ncbi:reverse transcriptase domain-containing protein, partial [Tanacetum coccineum]
AAETWLENQPPNSITSWDDLVSKFLNRFFPHSKTRQIRKEITNFQQVFDSLNTAAGGNLMTRNTQDALTIIKNKARVRTCRNKPQLSSSGGTSTQINAITALTKQVKALEYHFASMRETYNQNQEAAVQLMQNQMGQMADFQESPLEKEQEPETITEVVEIASSKSTPLVPPPKTPPLFAPKPKEDLKIDIVDSLCNKFHIENNSLSGNTTPSSDSVVKSLSPSFTPSGEIDLLLEETDTFLSLNDSIPSGIENGIYDSERDILFLEELLNDEISSDLPPKELKDDKPSTTKYLIQKPLEIDNEIYDSVGDILFLENLLKDDHSEADKSEIYTLKGEPPDTFLMEDKEIELNPLKDSDDFVPIPRVSVTPLDSFDSFFDWYDTSYTNPSKLNSDYTLNNDNEIFNI